MSARAVDADADAEGFGVALPVYLGLCLILGGASAAGVLANAFLQLAALAILAVLAWRGLDTPRMPRPRQERVLFALVAIAAIWPLLQLVPLPPTIWQNLPGRGFVLAQDRLLGMPGVWRPISLQPDRTLISLLGLLPPVAALALTLRAGERERRSAVAVLLLVAVVSSAVGLAQVLQGGESAAYFYSTTNTNTSVGFFANSNHLATLFLLATAFSARFPYAPAAAAPAWRAVRLALVVFFLLNLAVNRSLAGYLLALPTALFAFAASREGRAMRTRLPWLVPAGIAAVAVTIVGVMAAGDSVLAGLALNTTDPSRRLLFLHNTLILVRESFPFGYGLGTFRWSYAGIENIAAVTLVYVNHAHNDIAELLSDLGLGAVVVIGGLVCWYVMRLWRLAYQRVPAAPYTSAALMGVAIVALHSLVDYPARTAAIAAAFSMCLGMVARPGPAVGERA